MDGRTDGRNFSPFYRTSSPVGAAAQKREEKREARRQRQERELEEERQREEERRNTASQGVERKEIVVVTWNVQRMSLGNLRKQKARAVAGYATRRGWDVVLLSEVWAESGGVVWMGEGGL